MNYSSLCCLLFLSCGRKLRYVEGPFAPSSAHSSHFFLTSGGTFPCTPYAVWVLWPSFLINRLGFEMLVFKATAKSIIGGWKHLPFSPAQSHLAGCMSGVCRHLAGLVFILKLIWKHQPPSAHLPPLTPLLTVWPWAR